MSHTLVLAAHPQLAHSRITRCLLDRARTLPGVRVHDLYASYPDYFIDVAREQAAMAEASLVVWLHPVHWYGMPALMKLWLDEVLTEGWAYGPSGHALRGKRLLLATSTGGAQESYHPQGQHRHGFDAFLPPYEQTAHLCGMQFMPPLVLHAAHQVNEAQLQAHEAQFVHQLSQAPR